METDIQAKQKIKNIVCPYCKKKLKLKRNYHGLSSWFNCSCLQWRYSVKQETWIRYPTPEDKPTIDKPIINDIFIFR